MGKAIFTVLLIVLSILAVAISGGNQQASILERNLLPSSETSSTVLPSEPTQAQIYFWQVFSFTQFHGDFWTTGTVTSQFSVDAAPPIKESITAFLFEHNPQPCWLSLVQSQGQSLTLNRVSSETKLNQAGVHRFARHYRQLEIQIPSKCSRNLLESSPPGFFLLI
jgi:hypothetical protein